MGNKQKAIGKVNNIFPNMDNPTNMNILKILSLLIQLLSLPFYFFLVLPLIVLLQFQIFLAQFSFLSLLALLFSITNFPILDFSTFISFLSLPFQFFISFIDIIFPFSIFFNFFIVQFFLIAIVKLAFFFLLVT